MSVSTFAYDASYRGVFNQAQPGLGGNIDQGDPYSHAPSVWDYVVHRFAVRSVLDVGCGEGHAAAYFHRVHGCAVTAFDGLRDNLERAVYPIVVHDLRLQPFITRVDLVYCVETVEHIEPDYMEYLLMTLACGRVILMTHALPGQGGHHHVNCQSQDYWVEVLSGYGYLLSSIDTAHVRKLAVRDDAQHFATGLVFTKTP